MAGEHSRNLRDGLLTIVDGTTPTPNSLVIPLQNGDLNFTEMNNMVTIKNRGVLDHRRPGDEEEMAVSFSIKFVQWAYATGTSTGVSPIDALRKRNGASAWASTGPACGPYCVDLKFSINNPCVSGDKEHLTFPDFVVTDIKFGEGAEADTVTITGRSFATTPVRTYTP